MPLPGLFVTLEGGEGTGKTTQLERLASRLRAAGRDPLLTREPGGTPLAESLRALLMAHAADGGAPHPLAEAFLMEAARADLVHKVIRPALDAGRVVLCDRYTDSTLAYQGAGRGLEAEFLSAMNAAATGGLVPDLTLLFDLDPELGIARRGEAVTRFDAESLAFHRRVRARMLELAAAEPGRFEIIDAAQPADTVAERVWQVVSARLS